MAGEDGRIVVEVATVQRLRVDPLFPLRQGDQRHRGLGPDEFWTLGRGDLDTDIGTLAHCQQVRTLAAHDGRASHDVAQATLIQDRDVQGAAISEEAPLSAESSPDALLRSLAVGKVGEQPPCVLLRLQQPRHDLCLILPQRHRLGVHLRPPLEPVRMLHLRVPVDPSPQPQQHSTRPQQFVALLGERVLRYARARLDAGHLRAIARDLVRQPLLRETGRLPEVPQDLPEHGGIGGCRSTLCIASSSAHRIPLGARW